MDRARARVKELITVSITQAKPFRLDDASMMAPQNAAPFLIALSSGCRPKALANCSFNSMLDCKNTGLTRVVLADVPKDKFCDARIIRFFCTCIDAETKHDFCPLHGKQAKFAIPIEQNILTRAIKSHYLDETTGYSAYSARRATACAIAQLVSVEEGKHIKGLLSDDSNFKARVNAQFGWCPKSEMLLHYCKGHFALTLREKSFFYPLYMYLRYGATQAQRGSSFIINIAGDAAPPPGRSSQTLVGPNTFSDEVDTSTVPIFRVKNRRMPLAGEAAIAAAQKAGKSSAPAPENHDPSVSSMEQKSKRGRKKGGQNRPKEAIEAEKQSKMAAMKKSGRPAKCKK
jgi:hypothetical protein